MGQKARLWSSHEGKRHLGFIFRVEHAQDADGTEAEVAHQDGGCGATAQGITIQLCRGFESHRTGDIADGQVTGDGQGDLLPWRIALR